MYFWYNSLCRLGKLFVKCAMCCITLTPLCINHQNVWIRKSDPMSFQCCHFTCTEDFPSTQSSFKKIIFCSTLVTSSHHILVALPSALYVPVVVIDRCCCDSTFPLLNHFSVLSFFPTWQWLWCLSLCWFNNHWWWLLSLLLWSLTAAAVAPLSRF